MTFFSTCCSLLTNVLNQQPYPSLESKVKYCAKLSPIIHVHYDCLKRIDFYSFFLSTMIIPAISLLLYQKRNSHVALKEQTFTHPISKYDLSY